MARLISPCAYSAAVNAYNRKLIDIWYRLFKPAVEKQSVIKNYLPLLHLEQAVSPIWFLGMNPSVSSEVKKKWGGKYTRIADSEERKIKDEQLKSHKTLPYFKKLEDFYQNNSLLGRGEKALPIFHDMYPVRHTNQKEFEAFLKTAPDLKQELDDANKAFLEQAAPKVIVVFNSKASEHLKEIFDIQGPVTTTNTVNGITFVYSSMYTGQRALDKYARLRLAREIREIVRGKGL
jgi:hypothetical protein